jgi:hypothetical protein
MLWYCIISCAILCVELSDIVRCRTRCRIVLPCFIYCSLTFCIVLYCIVLYCIALYCIVLFCIVLYCFVLFCFVLFCFVLFCLLLYGITFFSIVLHCTVLYCTVLCCIVLHSFVQYCILQNSLVLFTLSYHARAEVMYAHTAQQVEVRELLVERGGQLRHGALCGSVRCIPSNTRKKEKRGEQIRREENRGN